MLGMFLDRQRESLKRSLCNTTALLIHRSTITETLILLGQGTQQLGNPLFKIPFKSFSPMSTPQHQESVPGGPGVGPRWPRCRISETRKGPDNRALITNSQAPRTNMMPTLGPKVHKQELHRAVGSPRECINKGKGPPKSILGSAIAGQGPKIP